MVKFFLEKCQTLVPKLNICQRKKGEQGNLQTCVGETQQLDAASASALSRLASSSLNPWLR